jgi:hypothetical protein
VGVQRLSNSGRSGFSYKSLIAGITPIPSVPTIGTATALTSESVSVAFTAPGAYSGATYTATSSPDGVTASSATSPIVVTGLLAETAYTFTVTATNATGTSGASAASNSATTLPAATASMDALATVVVPAGGVSSITFAGLPTSGQYAHLQLRLIARGGSGSSNSSYMNLNFNNDSSSSYAAHQLFGDGSSAAANAFTTQSTIYTNRIAGGSTTSTTFGAVVLDILDYASTTKFKTIKTLGGYDDNGSGRISFSSGLYQSTNALNQITLTPEAGNFPQYSQFTLYGVRG